MARKSVCDRDLTVSQERLIDELTHLTEYAGGSVEKLVLLSHEKNMQAQNAIAELEQVIIAATSKGDCSENIGDLLGQLAEQAGRKIQQNQQEILSELGRLKPVSQQADACLKALKNTHRARQLRDPSEK